MSDEDDQGRSEAERISDRRAEKLSRAIETARVRRNATDGGGATPRKPRKAKLPPPPPVDPDDLRAMGLPIPKAVEDPEVTAPDMSSSDTSGPLILGTGETRAVAPSDLTPPEPEGTEGAELDPSPKPRGLFGRPTAAPEPQPMAARPTTSADKPTVPLLRLNGVFTDIGRYRILQGVDLEVPEGQVTMLLGRNGVGKTTTLRTIMGLWRAREGDIWMDGRNLAALPPTAIACAGVGYVPEDMGIFGDLTVEENMRLGALSGRPNRTRLEWLLGAFPALKTFWTRPAMTLSGGQKQMLSIARTMVEPRRLYLIDEPTKGLAPAIISTLAGALKELKHEGATILMVEQNFAVAKALGDSCAVMDDGQVVWTGKMATLAGDPALQAELMGLHLEPGQ